jgi:hypothetical protein
MQLTSAVQRVRQSLANSVGASEPEEAYEPPPVPPDMLERAMRSGGARPTQPASPSGSAAR